MFLCFGSLVNCQDPPNPPAGPAPADTQSNTAADVPRYSITVEAGALKDYKIKLDDKSKLEFEMHLPENPDCLKEKNDEIKLVLLLQLFCHL